MRRSCKAIVPTAKHGEVAAAVQFVPAMQCAVSTCSAHYAPGAVQGWGTGCGREIRRRCRGAERGRESEGVTEEESREGTSKQDLSGL